MSTTSGPKVTNAQQGRSSRTSSSSTSSGSHPRLTRFPHTPLLDIVETWDTHYSLWMNEDGTITDFVDEISADAEVRADIERFGLVDRRGGRFIGVKAMDKLLSVSEAANTFVRANLEHIARYDNLPASCRGQGCSDRRLGRGRDRGGETHLSAFTAPNRNAQPGLRARAELPHLRRLSPPPLWPHRHPR